MSRRIVIVGGGFAGAYCAQALERAVAAHEAEIVLLDRFNYLVFTPLLVEAGTGNLEPRHCVVPLRSFLTRGSFQMAEVTHIDLEQRRVAYRTAGASQPREMEYEHLVLAPGSVTRLPDVPGLEEFGCAMKSLTDAVSLRDRAVALLEAADAEPDPARRRALLHFVVVGANFTGAEVAGEYEAFLRRATRHYRNLRPSDIQVTLVERADRILPSLDADLAEYARRQLERRGTRVRLNASIREIQGSKALLDGGEELAACTVIWCAGIAPPPLVEPLPVPKDQNGYVLCEPDFRVRGFENVWAVGDAAVNLDPDGNPYPATAQNAVQEGTQLARNLARVLRGGRAEPLRYRPLGSIVALGCRSGVAKILGIKLAGFPAWWMYRTVYLLKMPGFARKLRVALDWTMDLFFAPDFVQLGVHRGRGDVPGALQGTESPPGRAEPWEPASLAETSTTRRST
jgi:NADH dehydrogenase